MSDIGDFSVLDHTLELARDEHAERSPEAKGLDEEKRAPVTTDYYAWKNNPDHLDFPGIDTPSESPNVLPKDQMDPAATELTAKARDEAPIGPLDQAPSASREVELARQDVSLSPNEAFEGAHTGSQKTSQKATTHVPPEDELASGIEADMAFDSSELMRL